MNVAEQSSQSTQMQPCSGIISQCRVKLVGMKGMDAFVGYSQVVRIQ